VRRVLAFGRQSTVWSTGRPGGVVSSDLIEMYRRMVLIREVKDVSAVALFDVGAGP
jgi:hypothetical protein